MNYYKETLMKTTKIKELDIATAAAAAKLL